MGKKYINKKGSRQVKKSSVKQNGSSRTKERHTNRETTGEPVSDFPIKFTWNSGWEPLFDKQIEIIRLDIERARFEGNLVAYLSCPISSRGGGYKETNVDINQHAAYRIVERWGHRIWVLNPTQYQMESKVGKSLIERHAEDLDINISSLPEPTGGDYMRMWTKVLVEDEEANLGSYFDMYYFLGPSDVQDFFSSGGAKTITAGVEEFFARKAAIDPEFRSYFFNTKLKDKDWIERRQDFFRFYAVRASANYSKGCHDEWNIWCILNERRIEKYGIGSQIAGYFEGQQIDSAGHATKIEMGYGK